MTTNITPIEDKIKVKFIEESDIKLDRPTSGMHHNNASAIKVCVLEDTENGIIIISKNERSQLYNKIKCQEIYEKYQALAPQECDVTKCEFYFNYGKCRIGTQTTYPEKSYKYDCKDNPNCYYKQLQSQQKTFTVEEVKSIIEKFCNEDKEWFCMTCLDELLTEFEKECG